VEDLIAQIRQTARELLDQERVEIVLGFETGPVALRSSPCFVRTATEPDRLTWGPFCGLNLAVFLNNNPRRVAVIAKGCDSRAIVNLVKERRIVRENLVIVGVPCQGMIARNKVERLVGGAEVEQVQIGRDKIVAVAEGNTFDAPIAEMLRDSCLECEVPTPQYYDILLDRATARQPYHGATSSQPSKLDCSERWKRFETEAAKCIRCYACRNVCPLCYCRECCADQSNPRWIGTSCTASDNQMYLLMRALHLAGRCVDCGACVDACPVGVDVRYLFKRMEREVRDRFGYVPGADPSQKPPLAAYALSDPDDFITSPCESVNVRDRP